MKNKVLLLCASLLVASCTTSRKTVKNLSENYTQKDTSSFVSATQKVDSNSTTMTSNRFDSTYSSGALAIEIELPLDSAGRLPKGNYKLGSGNNQVEITSDENGIRARANCAEVVNRYVNENDSLRQYISNEVSETEKSVKSSEQSSAISDDSSTIIYRIPFKMWLILAGSAVLHLFVLVIWIRKRFSI